MKRLFLLAVLLFAQSCGDDPDNGQDKFSTFDRKQLLSSLAGTVIRPGFDSLLRELTLMEDRVTTLTTTPTEAAVTGAQEQWIAAARAWKRVEFFKLGLLDESLPMLAKVDFGAADPAKRTEQIDSAALVQAITTTQAIDAAYVDTRPATLQGFPVLEYMLFHAPAATIVSELTTDANAEARKSYLRSAAQLLKQKLALIAADWAGGYQNTFRDADGRDIGSSLGMLVNDLAFLSEAMKNEKLGRPLGFRTAGVKQPNAVEARLSGQSLVFLLDNLQGIERAITGDFGATKGVGFDELLDHLDAKYADLKLSQLILQQIQVIRQKVASISTPLPEAVTTNTATVQQIYDELKKLVVLLKVDMTNNIGVMITYTDNDGD